MARAYQPKRHTLALVPSVGMADLLAAREDICNLVKTSSGSSREGTACAVNKVELLSEHLVGTPHPGDSLSGMEMGDVVWFNGIVELGIVFLLKVYSVQVSLFFRPPFYNSVGLL